jgi:putative FmdB family regulatory protein
MPIYEYACESCGHVFDVLQKMDADLLQDCPECGKPELKKLLSAPNFRLKGGGWYETDFKKDNQRNLHDDSKPAAKKDKKPDDAGKAKDGKSAAAPKSGSSAGKSD